MFMLLNLRNGTDKNSFFIAAVVMLMNRIIRNAADKLSLSVITFLCMDMQLFQKSTRKLQGNRLL
jgi:hypothetical protein